MRFDSLSDWLDWQEQLHPSNIELGLARVREVWSRLHTTTFACPVISVAGTNGKGSSVAMLQAIYLQAGYSVAAYTSPHLWHYNERVTLNGAPVSDDLLCEAFARIDAARGDISLTYFEFGTLAALDIFLRQAPEVVILEVGLGGRLDAVNIIDADVALITSIALDHQQWLGEDRESIAYEKAGILRGGRPGVLSDPEIPQTLLAHAQALGTHLQCLGRDYRYQSDNGSWSWHSGDTHRVGLPVPALVGAQQLQNAAGVLMVVESLADRLPVSQADVRNGLLNARVPGRFEIRHGTVTVIFDVAHNPAAARELARSLAAFATQGRVHAVFAALADKDIPGVIAPLCAQVNNWYLAALDVPRAADLGALARAVHQSCGDKAAVQEFAQLEAAWQAALQTARPGETVLVFGSFYTVARLGKEGL